MIGETISHNGCPAALRTMPLNVTMPVSGRLFETLASATSISSVMSSPGRSGASQRNSLTPGEPSEAVRPMKPSNIIRIMIEHRCQPDADRPPSIERELHVRVPGVVDVVGEPGSRLQWERDADGTIAIEVERGVAWVRGGEGFVVLADGDALELGGACVRVEVVRGFLSVDVEEDAVACDRVDAAIARAAAELSTPRSR